MLFEESPGGPCNKKFYLGIRSVCQSGSLGDVYVFMLFRQHFDLLLPDVYEGDEGTEKARRCEVGKDTGIVS